jgi:hypothetical protein
VSVCKRARVDLLIHVGVFVWLTLSERERTSICPRTHENLCGRQGPHHARRGQSCDAPVCPPAFPRRPLRSSVPYLRAPAQLSCPQVSSASDFTTRSSLPANHAIPEAGAARGEPAARAHGLRPVGLRARAAAGGIGGAARGPGAGLHIHSRQAQSRGQPAAGGWVGGCGCGCMCVCVCVCVCKVCVCVSERESVCVCAILGLHERAHVLGWKWLMPRVA